ncbi:MAG: ABC transporter permease [Planctomycetes bacterium]|nr:ABC transporter permease [Planctomycetota bacterium]MCB9936380.1 ABC transporter permease [Planctomycetota bacterium]
MEATEAPGFFKRLFLNPLAVRELRVACRSWKLVIILTAYLLIQGAILAIWLYVQSNSKGMYEDPTSIGSGLFTVLSAVLVVVVMLVFPAFSSTAIASEHERKSFDLLLLTPLSPWEIAIGKFIAAALQASIFLVATVPLFAIANLFGGIDPGVFFFTLWVLILLSLLISFVGVYASSLVKKAIPAVLVTYLFAFVLGFLMLLVFITLQVLAAFVGPAFPLVSFFMSPTLDEGIYYLVSLTVTCAMYCTFLFISTTNRLKPTSHNKSTALRLFWSVAVLVVPAQIACYFMIARLPSHNAAFGTLVVGAVYMALLLSVPTLTAPAEAPVPSRRVRREMEKLPAGLMSGGGKLFFPGGDRGALHSAIISVVAMALLVVAAWFCYHELEARAEDDKAALLQDYEQAMGEDNSSMLPGTMGISRTRIEAAMMPESELKELVATFRAAEYKGFIAFTLVLVLTLLLLGQITWRLTLSGISKSLSGVLAGLLLAVLLIVPYIAQTIGGSSAEMEEQKVAQLSPIQASINAVAWGTQQGRSAIREGDIALRLQNRADALQWRWATYCAVAGVLTVGLLGMNLASRKKILERIRKLNEAGAQAPEPVQATQEQVAQAIAAVTAPEPQPMAPSVMQPMTTEPPQAPLDDLPEFDDLAADEK